MVSFGGDRGGRLRQRGEGRHVLTRSAAAAAAALNGSNSNACSQPVDGLRRSTSVTSKVALKRAAALGDNSCSLSTGPLQQAKKRPALLNITNCSNVPAGNCPPARKPPISLKCRQSREANLVKEKLEPVRDANVEISPQISIPTIKNTVPERETEVPRRAELICVATQTSVSLEQRTELCVSQDLGYKPRQGDYRETYLEEEAWSHKNYTDIDENFKDPQMCGCYAPEIYYFLQMAELRSRPSKNFMETVQRDINPSMRGILIDWLVEVADEYKLVPDTLYLTVAYIDRFLSGNVVNRQKLQLLGISCMLIASKYEEICAPSIEEFCYITDNTYCRDEVLRMEKGVLNYLQFELSGPTTKTFLRRFIRAAQAGKKPSTQLEFLGNYLAELTLLDYGFLKYLPSMIASSAVFLAKVTLDPTVRPWTLTLQHYTGYKASELADCVVAIHQLQCNKKKCTLPAVREKYRNQKFKSVAELVPADVIPLKFFDDIEDEL
ncbi:hypothetical protein KP509_30G011000 [Ceratopteris richardii]|uniref:Cyclin N-terminal domain-containing protein n=1 Tax=Ceratopteris richardii TaxID=49495 RepID=A0A8T2QZM6_CERRI|nr:hypothetical protein KP509_30G011000 [Ceratopteris richardii]KAH7289593.1 hypothetical protein KP509_30G011000 [Ceratopteris richardii]